MNSNAVLSVMTVVVALGLATLLYVMLGFRENTHPLIYVTAGFLIAIAAWNVQTFWRTMLLRKHLKSLPRGVDEIAETRILGMPANNELPAANFNDIVPPSVVDATTRRLDESRVSAKSKQ